MLEPSELSAEVLVEVSFEAAHRLPWHKGRCQNLHGHSYRAQIGVRGPSNDNGVIIDFADLRQIVDHAVVRDYDHRLLNEILDNPTAELLAQDMVLRLCAAGLDVTEVVLWETSRSAVRIRRSAAAIS